MRGLLSSYLTFLGARGKWGEKRTFLRARRERGRNKTTKNTSIKSCLTACK